MAELRAEGLTWHAGRRRLVDDVSIAFRPGELTAIIGENGAGKSTLLRLLAAYLKPAAGTAMIDGQPVASVRPRERARMIGWLPQVLPPALPVTVADAVALGRFAQGAAPHRLGEGDRSAVSAALTRCGLAALRNRSTATLSGGELARVHLARAIAAATPVMLVDEPLAALDPRYRLEAMMLLRDCAVTDGRTVITVLHDIGLAARFADRIVVMREGRIIADGSPAMVVTPTIIAAAFGVEATIDKASGWPQPVFVSAISPGAGASRTG